MSENKKICSLCNNVCEDDSPVLVMGPYGNPRLVCGECSSELDEITLGKEPETIKAAMQRLGDKIAAKNPDDLSLETVNSIFESAGERLKLIEEGSYDFSLDDNSSEDQLSDIPEDQRETDEDRLRDEQEAKLNAKFDRFLNWFLLGAGIVVAGVIIWKIIEAFIK